MGNWYQSLNLEMYKKINTLIRLVPVSRKFLSLGSREVFVIVNYQEKYPKHSPKDLKLNNNDDT